MRRMLSLGFLLTLGVSSTMLAATPYIGAQYGQSKSACRGFQDGVAPLGLTATCDDTDTGYRVYGGVELTPLLGIEVGYQDAGQGHADAFNRGVHVLTLTAPLKVWNGLVVARHEITSGWSVVGRAGIAHWTYEVKSDVGGFGAKNNENTFTYGFGGEWRWVTFGYDAIQKVGQGNTLNPNAPDIKQTVRTLSVGLKWRFKS